MFKKHIFVIFFFKLMISYKVFKIYVAKFMSYVLAQLSLGTGHDYGSGSHARTVIVKI